MEYVDLGLSVKWANCNVGANSPEEFGDYFNYDESKQIKDITMPTIHQWIELQKNCKCELDEEKGGWIITGKNGNSIYLPIAGEGKNSKDVKSMGAFFWSSTNSMSEDGLVWFASFTIKGKMQVNMLKGLRYWLSVRGVQ